jgi:lipopolysaccharide/colanic/teichoic acid biosynthesis glycosyltransferase
VSLVCVLLDHRADYIPTARTDASLLSMPLGKTTLLTALSEATRDSGCTDLRILPTFDTNAQYEEAVLSLAPVGSKVVTRSVVSDLIHEYEPSDHVLVVDPRYWPTGGLDLRTLLKEAYNSRWAVHGVTVVSTLDGTQEYVQRNDQGQVTRIYRYYQDVTCSQIKAIAHSLVPLASALDGIRFKTLIELRASLSARGMISRDVPLTYGIVDVCDRRGILALNEQKVIQESLRPRPNGRRWPPPNVITGRNVRIHPSANIVGPVIIQDDVTVDKDVTIIGPSVIGRNCKIKPSSIVAQSAISSNSILDARCELRHCLRVGNTADDESKTETKIEPKNNGFDAKHSQSVKIGADASAMRDIGNMQSWYPTIKLAIDMTVAGFSLILLSPMLLFVAFLVKITSSGPVLFGHEREGQGGKTFQCLKFRTMVRDAHQKQRELSAANKLDGPQFKIDNDPRVTSVGKWLRATNIDELPQLINVFLGQMSIVGPRPSPFRENQICVPWRRARLSVRPGITGLWQICRDQRSEGDFHQWITYDIMYVRNLTMWLDLKILLATILTLGGTWHVRHAWLVGEEHSFHQDPSPEATAEAAERAA